MAGHLPQQSRAKVVGKIELEQPGATGEPRSLVSSDGNSSLKAVYKAETNQIQTRLICTLKKLFQMQQKFARAVVAPEFLHRRD